MSVRQSVTSRPYTKTGTRCKSKTSRHDQEIGDRERSAVGHGETVCLGRSSVIWTGPVGTEYVFTRPILDLQRAPTEQFESVYGTMLPANHRLILHCVIREFAISNT